LLADLRLGRIAMGMEEVGDLGLTSCPCGGVIAKVTRVLETRSDALRKGLEGVVMRWI
jgi:hypothetical protein